MENLLCNHFLSQGFDADDVNFRKGIYSYIIEQVIK